MKHAIERIAAACALLLMVASFFVGAAVILSESYAFAMGQLSGFCR